MFDKRDCLIWLVSDETLNLYIGDTTVMTDLSFDNDLDSIATHTSHDYDSDDNFPHVSMSAKISASNPLYIMELTDAKIFAGSTFQLPTDMISLVQALNKDRSDLNTDRAARERYRRLITTVGNEDEMMHIILPQILDTTSLFCDDGSFSCVFNRPWLSQHVFSERLGHPQPNVTCGLTYDSMSRLFPNILGPKEDLARNLQPLKGTVLPTLFFELKGPRGLLSEAGLQNQHNGACALRNIHAVKVAIKNARYVRKVLALGIKFTTESVQAACYWIDRTTYHGELEYLSADLDPVSLYDLPEVQKLVRNVVEWTQTKGQPNLLKDLRSLEDLRKPDRKRDRSPDREITASPAKKKRRHD